MDVDLRLAQMDERGIDLQVLSPNPLTFLHHVDADTAIAFGRRHNDALAVRRSPQHPDRLGGLAQLPMQDPDRGGRRAASRGVAARPARRVHRHRPGSTARRPGASTWSTRRASSWTSRCSSTRRPVASTPRGATSGWPASTGTCGSASPTRSRSPWRPWCSAGSWHATPTWTCASRTGADPRAGWSNGCATPPRPDRGPGRSCAGRARSTTLLSRLWWDAHVGGPAALGVLIDALGTDHLVGGTNFAGWDQTADPSFGDPHLAALLDRNARRLLRLERDRGRRQVRSAARDVSRSR